MKYYNFMGDGEDDNVDPLLFKINTKNLWFNEYDIDDGIYIKKWYEDKVEVLYNKTEGDQGFDYAVTNLTWLVITEKFKNVLERLNLGKHQFLPLKAKSKTDNDIINLYVLNICNIVDAIDHENSKYSESEYEGMLYRSLAVVALKGSKLGDFDMFKLKGEEFDIIVSENVKKAVKKNKITGCYFTELLVV